MVKNACYNLKLIMKFYNVQPLCYSVLIFSYRLTEGTVIVVFPLLSNKTVKIHL
jgi:hypothetical protein